MSPGSPRDASARADLDRGRIGDIAAETLLEHVLATMPGGVFTVDPRGASRRGTALWRT